MVSFDLGKEIEEDVFRLVASVGQRKNLSPHEESNLRPSGGAIDIANPDSMQDACHLTELRKRPRIGARNPKVRGSIPRGDSKKEIFLNELSCFRNGCYAGQNLLLARSLDQLAEFCFSITFRYKNFAAES